MDTAALLPANGDIVNLLPFETVERRVELSTEEWARDLRALFEHAKERFGDVSWESDQEGDRVWGHKAVIYARAPKAFKDRYFITRPFSRSPTSTSYRSPSPGFLPPLFPSRPTSPPSSYRHLSPLPQSSSVSVNTIQSEGTIHAARDGVLRLTHGDTPELFRAQLEWLYTGEGFGDVVEWISAEDDSGLGGSIRDSLGRRGDIHDRRDKLGQDLTYMWRSKLYVDVRIHLDTPDHSPDSASDDSDDSIDSLSSTAIFTAHKFLLVSRSPYFSSLLLNSSNFAQHGSNDIHLPTPPFTPAALHFCLGWMYAGHLDFSNRSFDLTTAFQIHRAATYLQLDKLVGEIEARVVHDFCHGLDGRKCTCRRCPFRAARVWRFASAPDVGAVELCRRAREYLIAAWGESWGREVATADKRDRDALVEDVVRRIGVNNIGATLRSTAIVRARMEHALRTRGRDAGAWVDAMEAMLESITDRVRQLLVERFPQIVDGKEMWDLVSGKGFSGDVLEDLGTELLAAALVSSILLKVDPNTLQTALPSRGRGRQQIESIKEGVVGNIRRRWMQVRDGGGFDDVENWALKEISDEIEIAIDDLILADIPSTPKKARSLPAVAKPSPRPAMPRGQPHPRPAIGTGPSARVGASAARLASNSLSQPPARSTTPPDPSGLRRLRLSSSASSASVGSSRSVSRPTASSSMTGPQARSPTAARQGSTVTIGAGRRPRTEAAASPTPTTRTAITGTSIAPRSISGPPRQLLTKATRPTPSRDATSSPNPAASITSVRTTATARSTGTTKTTASAATTRAGASTKLSNADAGPSRLRTASASSSTSTRQAAGKSAADPVPPLPNGRIVNTLKKPEPADGIRLAVPAERPRTTSASTANSVRSRVATINSRAQTSSSAVPHASARAAASAGKSALPVNTAASASNTTTPRERTLSTVSKAPSLAPSVASRTTTTSRSSTKTTPKATPASSPHTPGRSAPTRPIPPVPRLPSPAKSASAISERASSVAKTPTTAKPTGSNTLRSSPSVSSLSTTRSRLTSSKSTRSVSAASPPMPAPETKMKPRAIVFPAAPNVPSLLRSKTTIRSPSSSTDDAPEARTPRTSQLTSHPEPKILRDGSDVSDLGIPATSASPSPTKFPPVTIAMPRPTRKVSSSSTRSNSSAIRGQHPASAFDPPRRLDLPTTPLPVEDRPIPEGVKRFAGAGVELNVGVPCIVFLASRRARFKAAIKYIGHVAGSRGAWVGLEVDDLHRLGVPTLPTGTKGGIHYFHLTPPMDDSVDDARLARQRRIETIRDSLKKRPFGLGLGLPDTCGGGAAHSQGSTKRSASPYVDFGAGGFENPRALFVRPSDIVYVMGAE